MTTTIPTTYEEIEMTMTKHEQKWLVDGYDLYVGRHLNGCTPRKAKAAFARALAALLSDAGDDDATNTTAITAREEAGRATDAEAQIDAFAMQAFGHPVDECTDEEHDQVLAYIESQPTLLPLLREITRTGLAALLDEWEQEHPTSTTRSATSAERP